MAELQFEGLSAEGLAKNLVAQTDPKNRQAGCHQIAHRLHRIPECRRVARAVGQEDARRLIPQRVRGGGCRRHDLDPEPMLPEPAQDFSIALSTSRPPPCAMMRSMRLR